jgi:hypothetical protein
MIQLNYRCCGKKNCANLISTPAYVIQVSPEIISRWLATESPNNFRLLRTDFVVNAQAQGGSPSVTQVTATTDFTGNVGDDIAIHDTTLDKMYIGTVIAIDAGLRDILTDIDWVAGMDIDYMNDNSLHGGYYFEGRLTVNGVLQSLTVIASPDTFGYADLDISGILRIMTSLGKTGDYTDPIMKEPTKSGKFTLEYRECWYGSSEAWTAEGNTWYYVEAVRSEEQGSNLHEFVPSAAGDAPFFNCFEKPVYFVGLPFDLSFLFPKLDVVSPPTELTVTIKRYNSVNTLLGTTITNVALDLLEEFVNSLNIDPSSIETTATYLTVEISTT